LTIHVAVGGAMYLKIYNQTGGFVSSIALNGTINKLRLLPDNVTLVCGLQNVSLVLLNVNTNTLGETYSNGFAFRPSGYSVIMLEETPDQLYLVSGGGTQILFYQWTTMSLTFFNAMSGIAPFLTGWVSAGLITTPTYTGSNL
jgi:hypothetical protein